MLAVQAGFTTTVGSAGMKALIMAGGGGKDAAVLATKVLGVSLGHGPWGAMAFGAVGGFAACGMVKAYKTLKTLRAGNRKNLLVIRVETPLQWAARGIRNFLRLA